MEKPLIAQAMAEAKQDIEAWESQADPGLITVGISPHSAYASHPELFSAVADYAADGRPVAMHLAGSREEYQFVKYGASMLGFEVREEYDKHAPLWLPAGVSPVKYVQQYGLFELPNFTAVHCTHVTGEDIDILAKNEASVVYCGRANAKLGMGIAPLDKFLQAEMKVGIGTDTAAATTTLGMFEEMRVGLLMQRASAKKGVFYTAKLFLRLATLGGAEALGIGDKVGSLEPGKQADMVVLDLSSSFNVPTTEPESAFVHTGTRQDVRMTMVAGRTLYENGEWKTVDSERIFARNEEIRTKLRA
jgi:5-methylthioadenosine/S-adenosylhomocysteine deaminase